MTMKEMVEEFEKRGFKATKSYISSEKKYRFDISKDGLGMVGYFIYPEDETPDYRNYLKREFINDMELNFITEFNKRKAEKKEMNMKDVFTLSNSPTGLLEVDGRRWPVIVSSIDSTHDVLGRSETTITCEVQNDIRRMHPGHIIKPLAIQKVVFNNPETIVLWYDGTKTVVKAGKGETYDPEKGLVMAIAKKALGNKGNYYDSIRKWVEDYEDKLIAQAVVENILATAATGDDK